MSEKEENNKVKVKEFVGVLDDNPCIIALERGNEIIEIRISVKEKKKDKLI